MVDSSVIRTRLGIGIAENGCAVCIAVRYCAADFSGIVAVSDIAKGAACNAAGILIAADIVSGDFALAAVEALEAENRTDVLVYGVDFTDDARAALKEGKMTGSMSYSSVKYTEAALQLAVAIAQGKEYADPIYLPLTLVTCDNVAELDDWA